MIFLLLLGLLIPTYTHTEDQANTTDEHGKIVDACVVTYEKALRLMDNLNTVVDADAEYKKMVANLKKTFTERKPSTRSEGLLAHAIEYPNQNIEFTLKDNTALCYAISGSSFTSTVFYREALARVYEVAYEKARHKKFYDTDHTVEKLFQNPTAFKKTSQFHYYDQDGTTKRVVLPKNSFPTSTQESLATHVNSLKDDQLVPFIDGIKGITFYLLEDVMHESLIKNGDEIGVVGFIDTEAAKKHVGMAVVRKRGEDTKMIMPSSVLGLNIDDIQNLEQTKSLSRQSEKFRFTAK